LIDVSDGVMPILLSIVRDIVRYHKSNRRAFIIPPLIGALECDGSVAAHPPAPLAVLFASICRLISERCAARWPVLTEMW